MTVTPNELFECAAALTKNTGGLEAHVRAAISRAYYAAYHDCVAFHNSLPEQGSLPRNFTQQGTHVQFAAILGNPSANLPKEQQVASRERALALRRLHGDRVIADYRPDKSLSASEARTVMATARRIAAMT